MHWASSAVDDTQWDDARGVIDYDDMGGQSWRTMLGTEIRGGGVRYLMTESLIGADSPAGPNSDIRARRSSSSPALPPSSRQDRLCGMIPSVSDVVWTTLITGGTAVMTGALGWTGARRQTRVELLKLKQERDPGTAENQRFRQELYLRYLQTSDAVYEFPLSDDVTPKRLNAAWDAFERVDDEVTLFGAAAVAPARQELYRVLASLLQTWRDRDDDPEGDAWRPWFIKIFAAAQQNVRDDWIAARRDFVEAVRTDVGPGV